MKNKYLLLFVGVLSLLLVTGCGGSKNQVKCTAEIEQDGKKYKAEIIAQLDDNSKVKDASMTMTFDSEEEAAQSYSMMQMVIGIAKSFAEEGKEIPEIDIKLDGKSLTISNYAAFAEISSDEEEQQKLIGLTKDEFINKIKSETSEESDWSCK